jgi:predicted RNA binding protein YcfA (HicA-like mRNA interferase family)
VKIPRDVHGNDLVKALRVLGYQFDRQEGSHIRISTQLNGEHHVTVRITSRSKPARWSKAFSNLWRLITT